MKKLLAVFAAVFMVCIMTVPCFAYTYQGFTFPDFNSSMIAQFENGYKYVTIAKETDGMTYLFLTTKPIQARTVSGVKNLYATTSTDYVSYFTSSGVWNHNGSGTKSNGETLNGYYTNNVQQYLFTNYEFMDNAGNVVLGGDKNFLLPPLAEVIQGVAQETLEEETVPALNRAVTVVVVVGLICLASLVGLVVLKKVFRTFGAR